MRKTVHPSKPELDCAGKCILAVLKAVGVPVSLPYLVEVLSDIHYECDVRLMFWGLYQQGEIGIDKSYLAQLRHP